MRRSVTDQPGVQKYENEALQTLADRCNSPASAFSQQRQIPVVDHDGVAMYLPDNPLEGITIVPTNVSYWGLLAQQGGDGRKPDQWTNGRDRCTRAEDGQHVNLGERNVR